MVIEVISAANALLCQWLGKQLDFPSWRVTLLPMAEERALADE
jgi:hypothetical protein